MCEQYMCKLRAVYNSMDSISTMYEYYTTIHRRGGE